MQKTICYKTIFGPIVMNLRQNGKERKVSENNKTGVNEDIESKAEMELFEIVDDYIEQA